MDISDTCFGFLIGVIVTLAAIRHLFGPSEDEEEDKSICDTDGNEQK
jgi:hypothetical protein